MNPLSYTSIHQLSYLLVETSLGNLSNDIVNDSLQAFLCDFNASILSGTNESDIVKETIVEYVSEMGFDIVQSERLIHFMTQTTERILGDVSDTMKAFYQKTLEEIIENNDEQTEAEEEM